MKKIISIILLVIFIVLCIINIFLFTKNKKCIYNYEYEYYTLNIEVQLSKNKDTKIVKKYTFKDEDIMKLEVSKLEDDNYNVNIDNLDVKAYKTIKKSNYYKSIKEYEEQGFTCK